MKHVTKRTKGFTLIELLITMVIIGIISAIAIPAYSSYAKKARRGDAKASLSAISNSLERYFTNNNTYVGATLGAGGIYASQSPIDGTTKYYNLSIANSAATSYTLTATPMGTQVYDGQLKLDSTGSKTWNTSDSGGGTDRPW